MLALRATRDIGDSAERKTLLNKKLKEPTYGNWALLRSNDFV